ncbi:acetaldehyde dehydrogenase (acetylating) [Sulfurospirillum halorespirans]|uniref:Acetaldehyde dehydrogenase n=1 Tax=Sulfurospirillum halorespirans DSM 13726 TaxID=1193502 RepID=A0A1D7TLW9_9BACT|nr:acetaldehyde dehydrogenase (acetylating) [Sulfurospirillum halorespirans]AOO65985.1 acetaldehyde dehydrogenase [Sulfurospirillum halorespirans DSM 13726]
MKLKVAIIGTGNIGTDLLIKISRSPYLQCTLFSGRNLNSKGMLKAMSFGVPLSDKGIEAIVEKPECCDLVFDATSASSHKVHAPILKQLNKIVIDLTPAKLGLFTIPSVNLEEALKYDNLNMITCGGQASIPIAYAVSKIVKNIEYIELVSTIASKSAGPGTRANIDEYIETTEKALSHFSGCQNVKVIINLNPAQPSIDMNTTIYLKINKPDMDLITSEVKKMVATIQSYVPGYSLSLDPVYDNGLVILSIKVQGLGDYLPKYAGNLDIINSAAIALAEEFAKNREVSHDK